MKDKESFCLFVALIVKHTIMMIRNSVNTWQKQFLSVQHTLTPCAQLWMEKIPDVTITTHDKKDGQEILNMKGSV